MDPGNFGKPPANPTSEETPEQKLRSDNMMSPEGICYDYYNQIGAMKFYLDSFFTTNALRIPEETARQELREIIKGCRNYSEYFAMINKTSLTRRSFDLTQFLTEKGRANWARLDAIIAEMKLIEQSSQLKLKDVQKLKDLFEEANVLMEE